jgi:hypothetical protein
MKETKEEKKRRLQLIKKLNEEKKNKLDNQELIKK